MYTIENYLTFVSDIPNESLLKCFKSVYDQGENSVVFHSRLSLTEDMKQ